MYIPKWLTRVKDTWSWGRFAWQLALALGRGGAISSAGGTVWAVILGVPIPIALMVGYCTLVGAVYLAMAPLAYRALSQAPANVVAKKKPAIPNYAAWRHLEAYELQDAAKLWADIDPNSSSTNDSIAWSEVFRAKITSGDFEIVPRHTSSGHTEKMAPTDFTKIKKKSLKAFAQQHGYNPTFLRDA